MHDQPTRLLRAVAWFTDAPHGRPRYLWVYLFGGIGLAMIVNGLNEVVGLPAAVVAIGTGFGFGIAVVNAAWLLWSGRRR